MAPIDPSKGIGVGGDGGEGMGGAYLNCGIEHEDRCETMPGHTEEKSTVAEHASAPGYDYKCEPVHIHA